MKTRHLMMGNTKYPSWFDWLLIALVAALMVGLCFWEAYD
jgi:hypothetical protein